MEVVTVAMFDIEVVYTESGKSISKRGPNFPKWIELPDLEYLIGIDQSTTCTGIFIRDIDRTVEMVIDFHRMGDRVDDYINTLLLLLEWCMRGKRVKLFVYEALPKGMKKNPVLEMLHKRIDKWRVSSHVFSKLDNTTFGDIPPVMWKKHNYLGDRRRSEMASNEFTEKRTLAEDIVHVRPHFKEFLERSKSIDLDAFDAIGILEGYIKEHYLEGNIKEDKRKIGGEMSYYHDILVAVQTYRAGSDLGKQLDEEVGRYFPRWREVPFLHWNTGESFYRNIRQAMNYHDFVITIIADTDEVVPLKFRYGIKVEDNELVYLVIAKSKEVAQHTKKKMSRERVVYTEILK